MKKYLVLGLGAVFSVAFAGTAMAKHLDATASTEGAFANGISASRHNLSTSGSHLTTYDAILHSDVSRRNAAGTSEMCVFCHTPHFTNKASGPLWNRSSQSGSTVVTYGATISGNDDLSSGQNFFSTLACLTCHDGVTTFDNLVNRPGKDASTTQEGTVTDKKSGAVTYWDFFEAGTQVSEYVQSGRLRIGGLGKGNTGLDLSDDHPIGVRYRGQGSTGASASLRAVTTTFGSIDLSVAREADPAYPPLVTGNLWAVKGFLTGNGTIADLLRTGNGAGTAEFIQCASCHDLHYKNQTNPEKDFVETYAGSGGSHQDGAIDGLFLRRVGGNSDSGLCRTCHNK